MRQVVLPLLLLVLSVLPVAPALAQALGLLSNESWPGDQDQWIANNAEVAGGNGDNGYVQAFAANAAGVLARHFAGQVGWWEIWNEPNAWTDRDGAGNPTGGSFLFP